LTYRLLAMAALGALPVLGLAGALLLWFFSDRISQQFDSYLETYQQQLVAAMQVTEAGAVDLSSLPSDPRFTMPFSGWYWQIRSDDGHVLLQSASLGPDLATSGIHNVADLVNGRPLLHGQDQVGPGDIAIRAVTAVIRVPETKHPYEIIVTGPKHEIDLQTRSFAGQMALILSALGVAFLIATVLQIRFGLAPLGHLQRDLQQIRSGSIAHLPVDYPSEITPLVDEFNAVLDHNATLIDRARKQAGNLAHALKTPLSVLQQELATPTAPDRKLLSEQISVISQQIDRSLARIRAVGPERAAGNLANVADIVGDLIFSMELLHRDRALQFASRIPPGTTFFGDAADLTEMLGNLIDNACKWAGQRVEIALVEPADPQRQRLRLVVDDDGPGIPAEQRLLAMKRGQRLDETRPGSGLGLGIVHENAALYGGSLKLQQSALGGLSAQLDLPGRSG
jgi:signal transduction histidine kinase